MERKRRLVTVFVATLVLILSLGFTACNGAPETQHSHTYSNFWAKDETHHWQIATCGDTDARSYALHSFGTDGKCTECGYEQEELHTHSWSNQWSNNNIYHWHAPLCKDTDEIKDKAEHNFVNYICTECGYNQEEPHAHSWSNQWSNDNTYHWHTPLCKDTEEIEDKAEHNFVNYICTECGYEQEELHTHSWSNQWSNDNTYHWHASTCKDTEEIKDKAQHNFVNYVCTDCGYERYKPHVHSWSNRWSNDNTYHWHASTCKDTEEIKDKAQHNFVDYICTECGYNQIPDAKYLSKTDFNDVGGKFNTVVAPLYEAAKTILSDLVESGDVVLYETRNPRIIGIRYCYGRSLQIIIREDIFIYENGEKSEFLQQETGITLENFGKSGDEAYSAYTNFLRAENKSQSLANYETVILPYAKRSAELILAQYNLYKDNKEISFLNFGKALILSANSSLSETYNKIVANLNSVLAIKRYPLITNQDLDISFGGNISWEIVNRWILIQANVGNLRYRFYISFNENGEFSESFINHFRGTGRTGYTPSNPDFLNPKNEEFSDFFKSIKIEEIDLSNIENYYMYEGKGNALYSPESDGTFLYF